nr:hypothetical protein [Tanacetum cinerariifolium]
TMTDVTAPTGQAPTMAPPVRFNDQCLPHIRWVQTGFCSLWHRMYDTVMQDLGIPIQVGFNSLVHSLRALSALRRFGLRTASTAAKPCQGDSLEFYLITGRIPTVAAAGQKDVNSQLHAHSSNLSSMNNKKTYNIASATLMYDVMIQDRVSMRVLMSQPHKMAMFHNKDD